jgi:hypothetical protein
MFLGSWHRSRAVTLAVQMREGEQIAQFGKSVDEKLAASRSAVWRISRLANSSNLFRPLASFSARWNNKSAINSKGK